MGTVRIRTIVPDYSGSLGALTFTDGEAVADEATHAAEIAYCKARGYLFPGDEPDQDQADEPAGDDEPMPRRSASKAAWETYAVAHGIPAEEAKDLSRDQLVERFTSNEEGEQ